MIAAGLSEEILVKGCCMDDRSMQFALYSRFSSKMMTVCRRYTTNQMDAEDQLQEGFVLVFRHIKNYNGGSLEGWIRKIVLNQCLGTYRKQNNKILWLADLSDEEFDKQASTDQNWINEADAEQMMMMINNLPMGSKTVFNLAAIEGYAHHEIATILGIAESASRSQLTRARQALQKMYYTTINRTR